MNMKSSTSTNTKEKKKMMMRRGFMCQSPAATTVCMSIADARSVIVPRRPAASHLHHGHGQYMMMRRSTTSASHHNIDHTATRSLFSNNYNANACSQYYYSRLLSTSTSTPHVHDKLHIFNPPAAAYNKKPSLLIIPPPSSSSTKKRGDDDHDLTLKHQQPLMSKSSIQGSRPSSIQGSRLSSDSVLPSSADNVNLFQVVVMRVSLHCQGCAGKVKKHLSKMEGVTSFSIDLETKMVTVRGRVSPDEVLESISKVKKAELWPC